MASNAGYFRYPTVAGDTVVFVSEDDAVVGTRWRAASPSD